MSRLSAAAVSAVVVLGGCSGAHDPPATDATPSGTGSQATSIPVSTTETTAGNPEDGNGIDCAAIDMARLELTDASNAELERLGVDRSDPQAFPVQVLVTGQNAAEYWHTVRDALPAVVPGTGGVPQIGDGRTAELSAAADTIVGYWQPLDDQLDAIEIADGGEASVQEATRRYAEIRDSHPDEALVPAQQVLDDGIDRACGVEAPRPP
jgi:hypothetical protein